MATYAKKLEFEKAGQIRKTIFALNHIRDVSLIKDNEEEINDEVIVYKNNRIESYDIAHLAGTNTVGVMTVMEDGELKKADYRKFIIKTAAKNDDYGALAEVLTRRLKHTEWPLPEILVVDGGKGQLNVAVKTLKNNLAPDSFSKIKIVSVVKDEKHKAREILGAETFSKKIRDKIFLLNQDTHRFAIKFHQQKRSVLK
jgi:excinuclease ABC subunit C